MRGSEDVQREVRLFIEQELRRELGKVTDSESLLEGGILESLGVQELVGFIERRYAIGVTEDELMPENFETIEAIAAFVQRRQSGRRV
jgi:acyl carrier protein